MNVNIYSREDIENTIAAGDFPQNTAVISFCDPELKHADSDYTRVDYSTVCKDEEVFYCEIDDLDLDYLPEKGYTYDSYFPEVAELAEFIYKAYHNGMDIICQCEYGQSRSAGCAAAILEHFYRRGIDIFADYKYYPNQVVYHKVFDALAATALNTAKPLISIWWYTESGEFWDFSVTADSAVEDSGYLQYSKEKNHLNMWREVIEKYVSDKNEQNKIIEKGYKSIERGRVIFNLRTQCYEIICSEQLAKDTGFIKACIEHFKLSDVRYDFVPLIHYHKQELTGNPFLDSLYYENQF